MLPLDGLKFNMTLDGSLFAALSILPQSLGAHHVLAIESSTNSVEIGFVQKCTKRTERPFRREAPFRREVAFRRKVVRTRTEKRLPG
jgi:hypothetical protein